MLAKVKSISIREDNPIIPATTSLAETLYPLKFCKINELAFVIILACYF